MGAGCGNSGKVQEPHWVSVKQKLIKHFENNTEINLEECEIAPFQYKETYLLIDK